MNSTPAPHVPVPVTRPAAVALGTPQDIAVALYGAEAVTLRGFSAEPLPPTWMRSDVSFVAASVGPSDLMRAEQKRRSTTRTLLVASALAAQVALLLMWLLLRPHAIDDSTNTGKAWHVTSVQARGVEISTGGSTGQRPITAFVPVGSRLPTGEVLQSTVPEKSAYITSTATVVLRPTRR
ncbi:MAG: hypothetical protein E6Q67_00675 [Roseateles sp.]|nr:MAG: hypothetical protein E6Q67_00675 [Roseateles sp.]